MGRHRVYSARARGAFAPRAGQQRQQMRGGGGDSVLRNDLRACALLLCQVLSEVLRCKARAACAPV